MQRHFLDQRCVVLKYILRPELELITLYVHSVPSRENTSPGKLNHYYDTGSFILFPRISDLKDGAILLCLRPVYGTRAYLVSRHTVVCQPQLEAPSDSVRAILPTRIAGVFLHPGTPVPLNEDILSTSDLLRGGCTIYANNGNVVDGRGS